MGRDERSGPLVGYRVLDLGSLIAGPLIGTLLADFGADVVKIERPNVGDPLRAMGWHRPGDQDSVWWKFIGRNKRSVAADMRTAEGLDLVRRLVTKADVLIENFRPGVLERWGLAPDVLHELNPRLVVARVSGYGQSGPYRDLPGFGSMAESMTGYAEINGWPDRPPSLPPFGLADGIAALTGAFTVVSCLLGRDSTPDGAGQVIDIALPEPLFSILGPQATVYDLTGAVQTRLGNRVSYAAPRGVYRCSDDRWVTLSSVTQQITERVFAVIGRPELVDDPRYASNKDRIRAPHADELDKLVGEFIAQHSRDEVVRLFGAGGVAVAPIYTVAEAVVDPHFLDREMVVRIPDHSGAAPEEDILVPNVIAKLSGTPGAMRHGGNRLDADREAVLQDWLDEPPARADGSDA